MKHSYSRTSMLAVATTLCALTASAQQAHEMQQSAAAQAVTHLPYMEESWVVPYGGTVSEFNSRTKYFYDNQNRLVRKADYAVKTVGKPDDMYLNKYYYYEYDEAGHLVLTYSKQGMWDDTTGELSFMAPLDSVKYTYNDLGQKTEKLEKYYRTTYEYDADGNLSKESKFMRSGNTCIQSISYSGYVAPDCPTAITSESDNSDYFRYKATYTYNESHQPLVYEKYKETYKDGGNGDASEVEKTVTERRSWGYDEATGRKLYEKVASQLFEGGALTPTDSTVFETVDDDVNRIKDTHYEYFDGAWSNNSAYNITTYQDYNTDYAVTLTVSSVEGSVNDYQLSFPMSDEALIGGFKYHIYRDGREIAVADFTAEGAVDPKTKVYTYVDKDVESGTHDYFVQTVKEDELGETVSEWNVSNVVKVDHVVVLPTVRNLTLEDYRKSATYGYLVKVAWDAPEDAEKYKFQRYNVLIDDSEWADNYNTEGQETEWEVPLEDKRSKCSVVIESVFAYGKSRTGIEISMKNVLAGIGQTVGSDVHSTYAGGVLHLSAPANVKVYDAAGRSVKDVKQVSDVSLVNLPSGAYVVLVEHNGEVSALKVVK